MSDYTNVIKAAIKDRKESLEAINTPDTVDIILVQESEAEPTMVKSFKDITNLPAGTSITINTHAYMKTTKGMWVFYDGQFVTDFDFFIILLRAVDSHMRVRLAHRPETY